jgi:hypothetical protein
MVCHHKKDGVNEQLTLQDAAAPADWRKRLRRSIGWLLLVKLIALILIKTLFFSSEHRPRITPERVDAQLALHPDGAAAPTAPRELKHD